MTTNTNSIPDWKVSGDWFDVCKCSIPCPCVFAQTPSYGDCDGVMAYHIRNGHYGETPLDSLNVLALDSFKGNIWAGDGKTKLNMAIFFDEKANEQQREALNMIFSGKAGGFMAEIANLIGEVRGIEAPESFATLNSFKNAINGQSGSIMDMVDNTKMLVTYQPVKAFYNTWVVLLMQPTPPK